MEQTNPFLIEDEAPKRGSLSIQEIKQRSISSTALKEASKSIRHLLWYYNKPKETKTHFDFGNALELYFIDEQEFYKQVAVFDDSEIKEKIGGAKPTATKAYKEWKAEFDSQNEGKYIIPFDGADSFDVILKCHQLFLNNPLAQEISKGNYQDPFEWTDEMTGLKRYARTDIFNAEKKFITDIKTDGKGEFEKVCNNLDYFLQAYDQIQGAQITGAIPEVLDYYWLVITKTPPYAVDVFRLDIDQMLKVETKYYQTLRKIAECEFVPPYINGEITLIKPSNWYK